ncbi:hypothetical protein MARINOS108_20050 [Marinoscillum sp. 108]|nr:hypothetical protein MARINOS108_20050 [Marinoscillum sp. 108]
MDNALNFSIVSGSEGDIHVSNDALFIDEKSIGKEFKISTLALLNDDLYFSQTTLLGSDFIDRDKNKRKFIPIRLWKIKELNKNTKF